jgi:hypothetical protein
MITKWNYNNHGEFRPYVKDLISKNNYTSIDIGASARYWSYPECKVVVDTYPVHEKDTLFFDINIEDIEQWDKIFEYVNQHGKFDFSICSHTMEDVFNPIELSKILEKISKRGYIAIPSKYNEFTKLFSNKYRGDAHHKQFFDVFDNQLIVYPKFNWIETDERSDLILKNYVANELTLFWEEKIPIKVFGNGKPYIGDDNLINAYYNQLIIK